MILSQDRPGAGDPPRNRQEIRPPAYRRISKPAKPDPRQISRSEPSWGISSPSRDFKTGHEPDRRLFGAQEQVRSPPRRDRGEAGAGSVGPEDLPGPRSRAEVRGQLPERQAIRPEARVHDTPPVPKDGMRPGGRMPG